MRLIDCSRLYRKKS